MKRTYLVLAALLMLVLPSISQAQQVVTDPAAVRLAWDHDGQNLTNGGFKLYIDVVGNTTATGTTLATTPATGGFTAAFPALTPGSHQLEVSAYNTDVESARSNVLAVRVAVIPADPTNLRLVRNLDPRKLFGLKGRARVIVTAVLTDKGWQPTLQVANGYAKYRRG